MATVQIRPGGQFIKNLDLYAGDSYTPPAYTVKEGDTTIDAEDYTWKILVEDAISGADFVTLTSGSGITFPSGKFQWSLSAAQTAEMVPERSYRYDIQFTRPDGTVKTIQRGNIITHIDITRA